MPAEQSKQLVTAIEPVEVTNRPAGQSIQIRTLMVSSLYLPAAHDTQVGFTTPVAYTEYFPGGHTKVGCGVGCGVGAGDAP